MCVRVYVCMRVRACACMCVYARVRVSAFVRACVCLCVRAYHAGVEIGRGMGSVVIFIANPMFLHVVDKRYK